MFKPGQALRCIKTITGVCTLNEGDTLVYLGDSQARVVDGPSAGWLVNLALGAPVEAQEAKDQEREEAP